MQERVFPGESGAFEGKEEESGQADRQLHAEQTHHPSQCPPLSLKQLPVQALETFWGNGGFGKMGMSWRVWGSSEILRRRDPIHLTQAGLQHCQETRPPHAPRASHNSIENVTASTQDHPGWGKAHLRVSSAQASYWGCSHPLGDSGQGSHGSHSRQLQSRALQAWWTREESPSSCAG